MQHWKETADIVARLATLTQRAALATVVRVDGSAYRRPGAKLLIVETGETLGSVSGGCLEADVHEIAKSVIETGRPILRHYDYAAADIVAGLDLGCNGAADIFVQPTAEWPIAVLRGLLAGDAPFAITTDLATGAVTVAKRPGDGLFVEVLRPPPHLLVCGAGADAIPLVAYAADAGFRVTVLDHREALLDPAAYPLAARVAVARPDDPAFTLPPAGRTLAVVKTHSWLHDREWLRRLLAASVPYLGVLGPKARTDQIVRQIVGDPSQHDAHVFAPVGLDLGAEGPHQIAISIVAELLAFVANREPRHLWERSAAIHAE